MWINRSQKIQQDDLISIEGTVANKLEVKWKKSAGGSMKIQLNEYPNIDFEVVRFSISGLNEIPLKNNI